VKLTTDVLVIGTGVGGCATALAAARNGAKVIIISNSSDLIESSSAQAQGGIIYKGVNDSPELLTRDIMTAGCNINYPPAVKQLVTYGPKLVKEMLIDELKVPFDRHPDGSLDLTEEAAHSIPRIIHATDLTGKAVVEQMIKSVQNEKNIEILTSATAIDLLTLSHHSLNPRDVYEPPTCVGAFVLLQNEQQVIPIFAKETVLATGGLGQLYLHTTNHPNARGDGIAMASRANVRLINLEYIQFHPTALYHPQAKRFLISESVRGEGGVLIRRNGETFMERFHPQGCLAPRDVVARAIHDILVSYNEPCVYLDISHKPADWIRQRFPNIYRTCLEYGIDITKEPIPVVPAAHYSCGGIAVDLKARSSMRRLRAVGEVSCTGVHGANRLASTSLLEALVWGTFAGNDIADLIKKETYYFPEIAEWECQHEEVDPALIVQDWLTIKYTMWNYVGLVRTAKRLNRAKQILRELQMEVESFYARAVLSDQLLGLRNGVQTALDVLFACIENRQSLGCHYRID